MANYSNVDIKKYSDLQQQNAASHNLRQIPSNNVDKRKSRLNRFFVGSANMDFNQVLASKLSQHKVRKNAVKSVNLVFSASPEFLSNKSKAAQWENLTFEFVKDEFGVNNIVYAVVHNDETSKHLHVSLVPIDPKGKLNASHYFDGRKKCSDFATRYNNAVKHLGLKRDKGNIKSKPQDTRDFYRKVKMSKGVNAKADELVRMLEKDLSSPLGLIKCSIAKKHLYSLSELVKVYKARAIADKDTLLQAEIIKQENDDLKLKFENMGLSPDIKFSECVEIKDQIALGRSVLAEMKTKGSALVNAFCAKFSAFMDIHLYYSKKKKIQPR